MNRLAVLLFVSIAVSTPVFSQNGVDAPPREDVETPAQMAPASPLGVTPSAPSESPTGYSLPIKTAPSQMEERISVPIAGDILKVDADYWKVEFAEGRISTVTAKGNVRADYDEFSVVSDAASADLSKRVASFTENVILTIREQQIFGSRIDINLDTREWSFTDAHCELTPELYPGILLAPVFLSGKTIAGRADEIVTVEDGGFTTCNLEHAHYFLSSSAVTVKPDDKLIAQNITFSAQDKKLFKIGRLVAPLKHLRDRQNLVPRVGQTTEEGFFMKGAYTLFASERNTGNLNLDLMSKKGVGLGFDDFYTTKKGKGSLFLYQLSDRNQDLSTLTGRFNHEQRIGTVNASFTSDFRANSYEYSPQTTSLGNELRLSRNRPDANTTLGIRDMRNKGFGTYHNLVSSLRHSQRFNPRNTALVSLDYQRSESPVYTEDSTINLASAQLTSKLDYSYRGNLMDWSLRVNKINDLSDESFINQFGSRYSGTEKLPELALTTSTDRLKQTLPFGIPAKLDLTIGKYREGLGVVETERAMVSINTPPQNINLADRLRLTASGGFRQYWYGDNTAQYSLETSLNLSQKLGDKSNAALSYRYLRPQGFTPFRFDYIGRYNALTASMNYDESAKLKLSLYGGYNFDQPSFPWQDLTIRAAYTPSERFLIYTATGYDLNRSRWRDLINQFRVRLPNDFRLDLGTRYNISEHKLSSIRAVLDTPVGKLWHVRANAGYNGFTKDFDYRQIEVVRDLHCWEASLSWVDQSGYWQDKGIQFNLRIKAFPIFDGFGVGQYGQALDSSVGDIF